LIFKSVNELEKKKKRRRPSPFGEKKKKKGERPIIWNVTGYAGNSIKKEKKGGEEKELARTDLHTSGKSLSNNPQQKKKRGRTPRAENYVTSSTFFAYRKGKKEKRGERGPLTETRTTSFLRKGGKRKPASTQPAQVLRGGEERD